MMVRTAFPRAKRRTAGKKTWLFITGMMGVGKSTVAQNLARSTGLPVWDNDSIIEATTKRSISRLFHDFGEHGFRRWERVIFFRLLSRRDGILSAGGGLLCQPCNRRRLLRYDRYTEIWLKASVAYASRNIESDTTRPLIENDNRHERLNHIARRRYWWYYRAHVHADVEGLSPDQITQGIIRSVRHRFARARTGPPFRVRPSHFRPLGS